MSTSCSAPMLQFLAWIKAHLNTTILIPSSAALCLEDEVIEVLLSLNTSKASGPDGISDTMLKSTTHCIASGLTKLLNKSISSGRLPISWKMSSVVPIPKGNDGYSVSNYRPISLLSIICKLLERHMYWQIATIYSPISSHQWGNQPRKITTAALLDVYNTMGKGD